MDSSGDKRGDGGEGGFVSKVALILGKSSFCIYSSKASMCFSALSACFRTSKSSLHARKEVSKLCLLIGT